jgi:hypothetical protein
MQRIGMRGDAESTKPRNILDNRSRFTAERVWCSRHAEGDVMSAVRADLDTIDAQDAIEVGRSFGRASAVAMISEDHELQTRRGRSRSNTRAVPCAIRAAGVHVIRAHDGAPRESRITAPFRLERSRRQSREQKKNDGGHEDRRHYEKLPYHLILVTPR